MATDKILVYGAAGYMGRLFTQAVQDKGWDVVAAGRKAFESAFPTRTFPLTDEAAVLQQTKDVKLVVNLAGPFKHTAEPLVKACLQNGCHYIDIAGEVPELQAVHRFDEAAKNASIMLMPGAGFGVVPTDIAAHLAHQQLPDAVDLTIGYVTIGGASRGTLKTVLQDINKEGVVLKNGVYEKAMPASKTFVLNADKAYNLVYNPWRADLFSARLSTGIANIETYANFPGFVVGMMKGRNLWLRDLLLKRFINFLPIGPSEKQRRKGRTICRAEVRNAQGNKASVTIHGPEAYSFTALTLQAVCERIMQNDFAAGYQTPSFYGRALLDGIKGVSIR